MLDTGEPVTDSRSRVVIKDDQGGHAMPDQRISRRSLLAGAVGTSALLTLPRPAAPAVKKGTSLRLWILKTYVEPTNKAIEASAQRWAQKNGASVTVEYFTFEDMQTKYVAAIEGTMSGAVIEVA